MWNKNRHSGFRGVCFIYICNKKNTLTRRKKIYSIPIAVAWMVIFLHGIIPHTHLDLPEKGCSVLYHCCNKSDHSGNTSVNLNISRLSVFSENEEHNRHRHFICHFSTGPFHQFEKEDLYILPAGSGFHLTDEEGAEWLYMTCEPLFNNCDKLSFHRRGPPA